MQEKIDLAAQPNKLYLFKEGMFYKIYNQNALWFVQHIKPYKVTVKYIKNCKQEVYSIGFPSAFLSKINFKNFALLHKNTNTQLVSYTIEQHSISATKYIGWCASFPKQKLQTSVRGVVQTNKIIAALQNFDITVNTPIQAFEFLVQLKKMLKKQ